MVFCSGKSVGAIIKRGKKILLLDRALFPFGWAGPAGHIDGDETLEEAVIREVKEETDLKVKKLRLLLHRERVLNKCHHGTNFHDWWVFQCQCEGKLKINKKETKTYNWFLPKEIKRLKLEPIWKRWFKELKII